MLCAISGDRFGLPIAWVLADPETPVSVSLTPEVVESFAASATPVARHFILSCGHPEALHRLAEAVPSLPIGFDPCHEGAIDRLLATSDFTGFVDGAVAQFPSAEMIYLDHRLALSAAEHDFDLIGAFHDRGKRIDAYTLKSADAADVVIAEQLLEMRADQITTDDPVGLEAALEG